MPIFFSMLYSQQAYHKALADYCLGLVDNPAGVVLYMISDARHGWVPAPRSVIEAWNLDISKYSYMDESWVYLEEDLDLNVFIEEMKNSGKLFALRHLDDGFESRIRTFKPYSKEAK